MITLIGRFILKHFESWEAAAAEMKAGGWTCYFRELPTGNVYTEATRSDESILILFNESHDTKVQVLDEYITVIREARDLKQRELKELNFQLSELKALRSRYERQGV